MQYNRHVQKTTRLQLSHSSRRNIAHSVQNSRRRVVRYFTKQLIFLNRVALPWWEDNSACIFLMAFRFRVEESLSFSFLPVIDETIVPDPLYGFLDTYTSSFPRPIIEFSLAFDRKSDTSEPL